MTDHNEYWMNPEDSQLGKWQRELQSVSGSPTFCILPWIHFATRPNGDMRLCCSANASGAGSDHEVGIIKKEDGTPANFGKDTPMSAWNNEYMKSVRIFFSVAVFTVFMISCSSSSEDDQSTIPEFDRSAVLVNYADNIIIPRLNNFKSSVDYLKESEDAFVDSPDLTSYTELHNSWLEAYINWQYVEMFNIGKAEEIMFFNKSNTYPVNEGRIQENINNQKTDLSDTNDWSCQGFPGLDYMIHGLASSEEEIINQYIQYPANGEYLKVVAHELNKNTDLVINDWNTYRNTFVISVENTATSAFNMLTNDFVYYFEKGLRTNKIGIPSGVFSNNPLSNKKRINEFT